MPLSHFRRPLETVDRSVGPPRVPPLQRVISEPNQLPLNARLPGPHRWIDPLGQRVTRPVSLPSGKARKMSAKVGYVYAVESIDGKHHELVTAKAGMNVIPLGPEATKEGR